LSLPKPDLDSKTFDQLVEEARKLIPGYSTEWTDHNLSDPGITLIDLFAWLSEISLYRINLVNNSHRLKYLKLLGVKPQPAKQAKVDLTFTSEIRKTFPQGTKVSTEVNGKEIFFQLEEEINILPIMHEEKILDKIVVDEGISGIYERSSSNEKIDLFFAPFGEEVQKGCALYLGFDFWNDEVPDSLSLMCYLYEKGLKEPGKHGTEEDYRFENARLKWEIPSSPSAKSSNEDGWKTVENMEDMTDGFKKSGRIIFKELKKDWKACNLFPELFTQSEQYTEEKHFKEKYFWLRCKVEESHYEYPPRIANLKLNTVSAIHGLAVKSDNLKMNSNGLPGQIFKLSETPVVDKKLRLSIEEWVEVQDFTKSGPYDKHFVLHKEKGKIEFGNGKNGLVLPKDYIVTIVKYLSEDYGKEGSVAGCEEWISKGLPDQFFEFSIPTFKLLVEEKWIKVDDFEGSGPSDKHFVLDKERGEIKFGDGKRGLVPSRGSIITLIKYVSGNREKEGSVAGCEEWVSKGLPGQTFKLKKLPMLGMKLKLSVEDKWVEVHDFGKSGLSDKHYVLDKEKGEIRFGNGRKGLIPPVGFTILLMKYLSTKFLTGLSIVGCEEWISKGLPDQIFKFSLPMFKLSVEKDKWVEVRDFEESDPYNKHFILDRKTEEIKFGNGKKGLIPPEGSIIIMKYLYKDGKNENSVAGCDKWISKDLPDQIFKLNEIPTSICEPSLTFKLLVEEKWIEVDDFEGSGPSDKHFVLDKEKGEIKFGDGLRGLVPSQGSVIRVPKYVSGGGKEGNLMPKHKWKIDGFYGSIENELASTGGMEAQSIEDAIEDFLRDLSTPFTAVTPTDFEKIAENTPGLRIAKAKAIPGYNPNKPNPRNPEENIGSLTVIIIPYTYHEDMEKPPEPSEGFRQAVCAHLDKHRLLGTDVHVITPEYVKVSVNATVVPKESFRDDDQIREKVREELKKFLHPITGGRDGEGWPIGRDIFRSELYDIIENIEGVNCVLRLSISWDQGASTDENGNLKLNKLTSVYSGVHNIEITR